MKRILGALLAMFAAFSMSGCISTIGDGNFGLVKGYDGKYKQEIVEPGWGWYVFSNLQEVYGKNVNLQIDLSPKDSNSVRLDNLVVNVNYRAIKGGAYKYVANDGDAVRVANKDYYYLGADRLKIDLAPSIQQVSEKWESETMYRQTEQFAKEIRDEMQKDVDAKYGQGVFEIVDVKIAVVDVANFIEDKIAQIQLQRAEVEKNGERLKALESSEAVLKKETTLLSNAIGDSGLSPSQYLEYRWQETLKEINNDSLTAGGKGGTAGAGASGPQMVLMINAGKQ